MAATHTTRVSIFLIYTLLCVRSGETDGNSTPQFCPYFQNRAPSPQPSLRNCTWYKENACCLNEELAIIFSTLLPMAGADVKCLEALNHLYCYVCSPEQNSFFARGMLTVCEESCNVIDAKCANTLYKGVPWREIYANGTEFCVARKFRTDKAEMGQCFDFTKLLKSFAMSVRASHALLILCVGLYLALHSYMHNPRVL